MGSAYIKNHPRPINHTKTYGGDRVPWTRGDEHGIECMWRNVIGGAASTGFHRPPGGLGLDERAQKHIRSLRMLLDEINIFESQPDSHHNLLQKRAEAEAYLTYIPDQAYAVYFPHGGSTRLDMSHTSGTFNLLWLNIEKSKWTKSSK